MDSTPFGGVFVEGFFIRPLKDTLYGFFPGQIIPAFAAVMNPAQKPIAVGGNPYSAAVNPATNRVYVSNAGALGVTVIDGASDAILDTALAGVLSTFTAVNPKSNRVYVTQDTSTGSRIWAVDGSNNVAVGSLGLGVRAGPMAIDTARNRVYVAANKCFFDPQQIALNCQPILGLLLLAIDGTSLAVLDTVGDVAQGRGIAYNPVTDRIYIAVSNGVMDTVKVINPATFQVIGAIEVQQGVNGVAVNPVTNKVYVTNAGDPGWVTVIDGATHTVSSAVFMGFSTFPQWLGVDPVRNLVYVSHSGVALMRIIDGATDLEVGQINMSGISIDAQPNPVTGRFYVTVYDKGVVRAMRYE
jgi:DNA-binding beta-propeller fold protein YncE